MLMCWCRLKALTDIAVLNVCNGIICSRSMMYNEAFSALEDFFHLTKYINLIIHLKVSIQWKKPVYLFCQ